MFSIDRLLVVVAFLLVPAYLVSASSAIVSLYDCQKDDIQCLDFRSFKPTLFNHSETRASFVEFYAHWCGACQRYAQHWRSLAKQTKAWHASVIRLAAINCGDTSNSAVCSTHNVRHYPTLKLFAPGLGPEDANTDRGLEIPNGNREEAIIEQIIAFLEKQVSPKPSSWPDLEPYTSKRLDTLFIGVNKHAKFAFLIFEHKDSYLGRKLILDFSSFSDRVVMRRVTPELNPTLFTQLEIDPRHHLPVIYLVNNTEIIGHIPGLRPIERFDANLLRRYIGPTHAQLDNEGVNGQADMDHRLDHDDDENNSKPEQELPRIGDESNESVLRRKYAKMIRQFINLYQVISKEELAKLEKHEHEAKEHKADIKKSESEAYLKSVTQRVNMIDLESALNYMLRTEIVQHTVINATEIRVLRTWVQTLVKYFPGRPPIKAYLKELQERLNAFKKDEMTTDEWRKATDIDKSNAYLPQTIEWYHCKGSDTKYRGYPCSLWTLFHVLTVSQVEIQQAKLKPFQEDFNVKEVIEAVRSYVLFFFTCQECSENFNKETHDYLRHLSKPYDAIEYLWRVHNSVNVRLAQDTSAITDPLFPKSLFPSRENCPQCYLPTVEHVEQPLAGHESPFKTQDVILFLTAFYSKYQIDKIPSAANAQDDSGLTTTAVVVADTAEGLAPPPAIRKSASTAFKAKSLLQQQDNRKILNEMESMNKKPVMHGRFEHHEKEYRRNSSSSSSDFKFIVFVFLSIFVVFGGLHVYFRFKKKSKLKKHII